MKRGDRVRIQSPHSLCGTEGIVVDFRADSVWVWVPGGVPIPVDEKHLKVVP